MTKIYLKYGIYNSSHTVTWFTQDFLASQIYEHLETERLVDKDIRYNYFSHFFKKRKKWTIKISANDLVKASLWNWINNFFSAHIWKMSFDNWVSEYDIILEDVGKMPVEFLENNKYLREVKLNLIEMI